MSDKLKDILNIGDLDSDLVLWAGSLDSAKQWSELIHFLANNAIENNETGYTCDILDDEDNTLCGKVVNTLLAMGISPPLSFPEEINLEDLISYDDELIEEQEQQYSLLDGNKYTVIISEILNALTSVYGFYQAFISDIFWDEGLNLYDTDAIEIEYNLVSLAACKIEVDDSFAIKHRTFKYKTMENYNRWMCFVKEKAIRAHIPLKAELLNIVNKTKDELDIEVESEALGFNKSRLHPDIYMNEILVGMRIIHQVLPEILKKLGIDKDINLDHSEFQV